MAINSRLLVCKTSSGRALYYAKPTLRGNPYFQILALFKTFQWKVHHILIIQELQTIKCIKQHNNSTVKLIKFVKLATWWLPQTRDAHIRESRWFESMYTLQGKTRSTRHTHPTLSPRMVPDHTYLTWSTHSNLSWVTDRFERITLLLRKRAPDTIPHMPADRSMGPYLISLPSQPMKQWA
jgi:hypothetical protein